MLIAGHIYIFFYVPISSHYKLYGLPYCDSTKSTYGCKNFHDNHYLRILYVLLLLYLWFSAYQIKKGFPLYRKPSTLFIYYNPIAKLGTIIVLQIPFLIEIRCLIDYMSSKTSLDYF